MADAAHSTERRIAPGGPVPAAIRAMQAACSASPFRQSAPSAIPVFGVDPKPDAELMDLGGRWRAAQRELVAADAKEADLESATTRPDIPDPCLRQRADSVLGLEHYANERNDGRWWYCVGYDGGDYLASPLRLIAGDATPRRVRAAEIVAAYDAWIIDTEAAKEASGLSAAAREALLARRATFEIEKQIEALPARTLAGIRVKAAIIQSDIDEEFDLNEALLSGLIADILALAA